MGFWMSQEEWLQGLSDDELLAIADELHQRAEQFDAQTRQKVNDELRYRKLPLVGFGGSRH